MALQFISKFIVATLLAAIFIASVESHGDCSFNYASYKGSQKRFNVVLKDKMAAESHYKWLTNCCDKSVEHTSSVDFTKNLKDTALDFSVENSIYGYSAWFSHKFVEEHLSKNSDIEILEEDSPVSINHRNHRNHRYRHNSSVRKNPTPNLDRIDEKKFPLDGKYVFPASAGKDVQVYIVDTGILVTHNEFEGRARHGFTSCDDCPVDTDDNGHGTHVAALVAGKTFGVANKANVIAVKVLNSEGFGSDSGIIIGLLFVLAEHKSKANQESVVNMSLGGDDSTVFNLVVKILTDHGVHVVAAAGNEASDACQVSPASAPSAITVGATNNTFDDSVTNFSNVGECVDIFAPGLRIVSAGITSNDATARFSGTSQATPHVAGTLALIIAECGNSTPELMTKTLIDLATKDVIPSDTLKGSPNVFLRIPSSHQCHGKHHYHHY